MSRITAAIAQQLALGARDVLNQAAAVVTGNQGQYIATGEPESIYGKIQQATARQACRRYADDPSKFQGFAAVAVENACRPYLDDIGYGAGPTISNPVKGGQCATSYRVVLVVTNATTGARVTAVDENQTGPISVVEPAFPPQVCSTDNVLRRYALMNGAGVRFYSINSCGDLPLQPALTLTRRDGLPDDCGSQPPDIVPPGLPPVPGPRRERYNPGPDVDIDIDVDINPDGTIDVDFGIGPVTIDPFPEPAPGEETGGPTGPPPGDVGAPGGPVETGPGSPGGEGGDAEGEAPSGSVLTGLRLEVLSVPDQRKRFTPEVLRGVCYVYMGVPGLLDHDPAGAMLTDDQFVFAEKENLTAWRVRANFGYNIRVTPYYREVE